MQSKSLDDSLRSPLRATLRMFCALRAHLAFAGMTNSAHAAGIRKRSSQFFTGHTYRSQTGRLAWRSAHPVRLHNEKGLP